MACRIINGKKIIKLAGILLLTGFFYSVKAQGLKLDAQKLDSLDNFTGLTIHQDPRIYWVLDRRREVSRKINNSGSGYRLLLYSGTKRQDAYTYQTYFKQIYPNLETYLTFSFPNFKLMGGDFRAKDDAQKVSDHIKNLLSINPILIPQKIDLTKVYQGN